MSSSVLPIPPLKFKLDIAVLTQAYSELKQKSGLDHVIELDCIDVPENVFKSIFYQSDSFSINPLAANNIATAILISFNSANRTVNNLPFCLIDVIMENIEHDLGVTSNMFSTCSLISLNSEINAIKTLCDLSISNVMCSLKWSDIVNTVRCVYDDTPGAPVPTCADVILTISVVFMTPTVGVQPTIIKFNYCTQVSLV